MGFPATESGIELKILEYLFFEDDAKMFLALSHNLEMTSSVASRLNQPLEKVAVHLGDMADRGLLFRLKKQIASNMRRFLLFTDFLNFRSTI